MHRRDFVDLTSGLVLVMAGVWMTWHAVTHYSSGTLSRIGPSVFPGALGVILAVLGLVIAVPAWFRGGEMPVVPVRPMIAVLVSILAFALLVDWVGMIPAVIVLVFGAVLADNQLTPRGLIVLTVAAAIGVWLIFKVLLGVSFPAFRWPL